METQERFRDVDTSDTDLETQDTEIWRCEKQTDRVMKQSCEMWRLMSRDSDMRRRDMSSHTHPRVRPRGTHSPPWVKHGTHGHNTGFYTHGTKERCTHVSITEDDNTGATYRRWSHTVTYTHTQSDSLTQTRLYIVLVTHAHTVSQREQ